MNAQNGRNTGSSHGPHKRGRGPSSFAMHNPDLVFGEIELKNGESFLDLGCGPGDYALHAFEIVGHYGTVYALDKWKYMIDGLTQEADSRGYTNIKALACDISGPLPIEDDCIDVCFMATVLHTLNLAKQSKTLWNEIHRVLKPGGRVAIINCKKEDQPFGPPISMRLSPEEVEDSITKYGFEKTDLVDLGYNYMIQFGAI
jgi:ubiquinone/menaquinone biosynthesis C-methylase UbiE